MRGWLREVGARTLRCDVGNFELEDLWCRRRRRHRRRHRCGDGWQGRCHWWCYVLCGLSLCERVRPARSAGRDVHLAIACLLCCCLQSRRGCFPFLGHRGYGRCGCHLGGLQSERAQHWHGNLSAAAGEGSRERAFRAAPVTNKRSVNFRGGSASGVRPWSHHKRARRTSQTQPAPSRSPPDGGPETHGALCEAPAGCALAGA